MAFTEDSVGGGFNSTNYVTISTGDANGRKIIKNVVVANVDTVSHLVLIEFVRSGVAYRMFTVTLAPNDSLVQDCLVVLGDANYTLRARLNEAAVTTQPHFVATLAQTA
jgi:hypothetical protein